MADTNPVRILIADDQPDILNALKLLLSDEGYEVAEARSPAEALERLEATDFDLAILDLNYTRDTTSGQEGLDLLRAHQGPRPDAPGRRRHRVEQRGRRGRGHAPRRARLRREAVGRRAAADDGADAGRSAACAEAEPAPAGSEHAPSARRDAGVHRGLPAIVEVRHTIERVAPSDAAVLITGEHGTGKEVVAAWLHALSERKNKPLVTMNAGGLAEGIAESELFGHVKGAFTDARFDRIGCFELADEGTLLLDEIANMAVRLQAKLLRVLQTGEVQRVGSSRLRYVNVRMLSATNADLPAEIEVDAFSEDLCYRLNTVVIDLPPLRERPQDIEPLALHFLARHATRYRQAAHVVRRRRARGDGVAPVAGERPRARARGRARGADGRSGSHDGGRAPPRPAGPAGSRRRIRRSAFARGGRAHCSSKRFWRATAATSGSPRSSSA